MVDSCVRSVERVVVRADPTDQAGPGEDRGVAGGIHTDEFPPLGVGQVGQLVERAPVDLVGDRDVGVGDVFAGSSTRRSSIIGLAMIAMCSPCVRFRAPRIEWRNCVLRGAAARPTDRGADTRGFETCRTMVREGVDATAQTATGSRAGSTSWQVSAACHASSAWPAPRLRRDPAGGGPLDEGVDHDRVEVRGPAVDDVGERDGTAPNRPDRGGRTSARPTRRPRRRPGPRAGCRGRRARPGSPGRPSARGGGGSPGAPRGATVRSRRARSRVAGGSRRRGAPRA